MTRARSNPAAGSTRPSASAQAVRKHGIAPEMRVLDWIIWECYAGCKRKPANAKVLVSHCKQRLSKLRATAYNRVISFSRQVNSAKEYISMSVHAVQDLVRAVSIPKTAISAPEVLNEAYDYQKPSSFSR